MKTASITSSLAVRTVIATLLRDGDASLQTVATQLDVSPRSLQRQLMASGTNFRELVLAVRLQTACQLLVDSELSLTEISCRLGYSGPSGFSRVFKKLMKVQPVVYRRRQRAATRVG